MLDLQIDSRFLSGRIVGQNIGSVKRILPCNPCINYVSIELPAPLNNNDNRIKEIA